MKTIIITVLLLIAVLVDLCREGPRADIAAKKTDQDIENEVDDA